MRRRLAPSFALLVLAGACGARSSLDTSVERGTGGNGALTTSSTSSGTGGGGAPTTSSATSGTGGGVPVVACHAGDAPVVLAEGVDPEDLAVDEGHVYFGGALSGQVGRVSKLGGAVEILADHQISVWHVAVDATRVYWSSTCWVSGCGILWADKSGGAPFMLAPHLEAGALAVDGTSVFWVDSGDAAAWPASVQRAPKAGGAATTLASDLSHPRAVALDETFVYWLDDTSGVLGRVPKEGGPSATIVASTAGNWGLAVDETHVYWSHRAYHIGYVASAPKEGGPMTKLATDLDAPGSVAVDGANLYVAVEGAANTDPPVAVGGILRIPRDGGPVTVLADGVVPNGLVVDDACVYWANQDRTLMRAPR